MRQAAVAAAVFALALSGCGDSASPDVHLKTPGYTNLSFPVKPHRAFAFGGVVLVNDGQEALRLGGVRLETGSGVRLVRAAVLGPHRRSFMTAGSARWPSAEYHITGLRKLDGFVVPPHSNVEPYLKLRASAGRKVLRGITIDYTMGGDDHTVQQDLKVAVCVSDRIQPHCHVPRASEIG